MKVQSIQGEGFRNLDPFYIEPDDNNVILGENAQGKTNFIEALWLFTGFNSFRGAKDEEFIKLEGSRAFLKLMWNDGKRDVKAEIEIRKSPKSKIKKMTFNNVVQKSRNSFIGKFKCCVFSPASLNLVEDGPESRRRFLDAAISQIRRDYAVNLSEYERMIKQRNAALKHYKNITARTDFLETVKILDEQISALGTVIHLLRCDYIKKIKEFATQIYAGISKSKEKLDIIYKSTVFKDYDTCGIYNKKNVEKYYNTLQKAQKADIAAGFTTTGIHRDEIKLELDGVSAKSYGSQGQKRSVAIALKLGEAAVTKDVCGTPPVILLDDILSELDHGRREYTLNNIKGAQVFLTSCDPGNMIPLEEGKVFFVKNGKIEERG